MTTRFFSREPKLRCSTLGTVSLKDVRRALGGLLRPRTSSFLICTRVNIPTRETYSIRLGAARAGGCTRQTVVLHPNLRVTRGSRTSRPVGLGGHTPSAHVPTATWEEGSVSTWLGRVRRNLNPPTSRPVQKARAGVIVITGRPTIGGPHHPSRLCHTSRSSSKVRWFAHGVDKYGCGIPTLHPAPDLGSANTATP